MRVTTNDPQKLPRLIKNINKLKSKYTTPFSNLSDANINNGTTKTKKMTPSNIQMCGLFTIYSDLRYKYYLKFWIWAWSVNNINCLIELGFWFYCDLSFRLYKCYLLIFKNWLIISLRLWDFLFEWVGFFASLLVRMNFKKLKLNN